MCQLPSVSSSKAKGKKITLTLEVSSPPFSFPYPPEMLTANTTGCRQILVIWCEDSFIILNAATSFQAGWDKA